jgi:K+-transporting ATPase ATPase C chain
LDKSSASPGISGVVCRRRRTRTGRLFPTNLGPTNPALVDEARARTEALRAADPDNRAPIPVDLVTSSASGLDPDISPAGAAYQVARVARARGMDEARVSALVTAHTTDRQLWILGEPRVHILDLNLALDALR